MYQPVRHHWLCPLQPWTVSWYQCYDPCCYESQETGDKYTACSCHREGGNNDKIHSKYCSLVDRIGGIHWSGGKFFNFSGWSTIHVSIGLNLPQVWCQAAGETSIWWRDVQLESCYNRKSGRQKEINSILVHVAIKWWETSDFLDNLCPYSNINFREGGMGKTANVTIQFRRYANIGL